MTQLGRVEYCLNGGASNTDFIDNAGGVDCSDHEVNIKILLNEIVGSGDMTGKQRNKLLAEMTDAVGSLVLGNNYKQTQALSLAQRRARERIAEHRRLINALEAYGKRDRALEFLPTDEQLAERVASGQALTRAELSVLISYSKINLKESLLKSLVPDDEYLARDMQTAFPPLLTKKFPQAMSRHRLKREIVSTQIANDLVNHMGITFVQRLKESTGMSAANVAGAYVIVRDVFQLPHLWQQIEALDYQVPAELQLMLMDELMRLGRRATRWFLRSRRNELDAARDVAHFAPRVEGLAREAFRDDLDWQQRAITVSVLQMADAPDDIEARTALWLEQNRPLVARWRAMMAELRAATSVDYAMYAVAGRELHDLAQSGQHGVNIS